jgi:hypothetical protein
MQRFLALLQSLEATLQTLDGEGIEVIVEETTIHRRLLIKSEAFFAHGLTAGGRVKRAALSVTDQAGGRTLQGLAQVEAQPQDGFIALVRDDELPLQIRRVSGGHIAQALSRSFYGLLAHFAPRGAVLSLSVHDQLAVMDSEKVTACWHSLRSCLGGSVQHSQSPMVAEVRAVM